MFYRIAVRIINICLVYSGCAIIVMLVDFFFDVSYWVMKVILYRTFTILVQNTQNITLTILISDDLMKSKDTITVVIIWSLINGIMHHFTASLF